MAKSDKFLVTNEGTTFRIDKLFDKDIECHSVIIKESLGGSIATIDCNFSVSDEDELYPINTEFTGSLQTADGDKIEFQCFLYNLNRNLTNVTMKFLCCKPEFTKNTFVTKYSTIDNAIESTWQLDRIDTVNTDVLDYKDPHYIYQTGVTNYHLCKKLCHSYKYNTTFGFLINGLRFVDLNVTTPVNNGEGEELIDQGQIKAISEPSWSDPKLYVEDVEYVDYNHDSPENSPDEYHTCVHFYEQIIPVDTVYKELIGNYLFNTKLASVKNSTTFELKYLPPFMVGDFIKIKSPQLNFQNCFLSSRVIDIHKADMSVFYEVKSIDPWK